MWYSHTFTFCLPILSHAILKYCHMLYFHTVTCCILLLLPPVHPYCHMLNSPFVTCCTCLLSHAINIYCHICTCILSPAIFSYCHMLYFDTVICCTQTVTYCTLLLLYAVLSYYQMLYFCTAVYCLPLCHTLNFYTVTWCSLILSNGATLYSHLLLTSFWNSQKKPFSFDLDSFVSFYSRKQPDCVQELLQNAADPNKQNKCGLTPLSIAIDHPDIDSVQCLILNNADVSLKVSVFYFYTPQPLLLCVVT